MMRRVETTRLNSWNRVLVLLMAELALALTLTEVIAR